MKQFGPTISSIGLDYLGLTNLKAAHWNYSAAALYEQALIRGEATVAAGGPLVAITGQHTGRSPNDKFIVQESSTSGDIWWGNVNKPITEEAFDRLHVRMTEYLRGREVFVQDLYAGADPEYRLPVRIVTQNAWHNLFAQNMFIRPAARDRIDFQPAVHRASGA